jgi:chorismate synthase
MLEWLFWSLAGTTDGYLSPGASVLLQVTREGVETDLRARGRHDPCVVPRAVPMVESMVAMVLADQLLQHYAQCELLPRDNNCLNVDSKVARQFARSA